MHGHPNRARRAALARLYMHAMLSWPTVLSRLTPVRRWLYSPLVGQFGSLWYVWFAALCACAASF
jgi:hypothetical protein